MKQRFVFVVALICFILTLPLYVGAVELNIRNEEQSDANVAIAYYRGGQFLVEGWTQFAPGQLETIVLEDVIEGDVYIYVEFHDPSIVQFMSSNATTMQFFVMETSFRYAYTGHEMRLQGTKVRKVIFQRVEKDNDKLWFNLGSAAG